MRKTVTLLCLIVCMGVALPAQAQLRSHVRAQQAPAKLYDQGGASFTLNKLFSPEHFRMQHSYEMSFGSFGGSSSSLGMYTNTMMWQFNQKLAARVDIAFAHSPFGSGNAFGQGAGLEGGRVFLRNAEVAYRPTEHTQLHFSVRQSPYGRYMDPYGYSPYSPYYYDSYFGAPYRGSAEALFWKDRMR